MTADAPILIVPYMWIGDFVRCHTVVKLIQQRLPSRPIDLLTTAMVAPLVDAGASWRTSPANAWPWRNIGRWRRGCERNATVRRW